MVKAIFHPSFEKSFYKIKDNKLRERIFKQFIKIGENPEVGKPMRYFCHGTREVYVPPFRLSYIYLREENKIIFLDLYHKDKQ